MDHRIAILGLALGVLLILRTGKDLDNLYGNWACLKWLIRAPGLC